MVDFLAVGVMARELFESGKHTGQNPGRVFHVQIAEHWTAVQLLGLHSFDSDFRLTLGLVRSVKRSYCIYLGHCPCLIRRHVLAAAVACRCVTFTMAGTSFFQVINVLLPSSS